MVIIRKDLQCSTIRLQSFVLNRIVGNHEERKKMFFFLENRWNCRKTICFFINLLLIDSEYINIIYRTNCAAKLKKTQIFQFCGFCGKNIINVCYLTISANPPKIVLWVVVVVGIVKKKNKISLRLDCFIIFENENYSIPNLTWLHVILLDIYNTCMPNV